MWLVQNAVGCMCVDASRPTVWCPDTQPVVFLGGGGRFTGGGGFLAGGGGRLGGGLGGGRFAGGGTLGGGALGGGLAPDASALAQVQVPLRYLLASLVGGLVSAALKELHCRLE
jgi:hypothetical protein